MLFPPDSPEAKTAMFFAGLILLIPHRIGMSRVNYVIKRYNLPISRAGLLLYKFHNPIEVSLTIGTLLGNIIVWCVQGTDKEKNEDIWKCMIVFLSLMFLSSIIMLYIYVIGSDYGHLNLFYFSLILITFFDGITNAFAFALNAKFGASLLSAGIPISGALVSLLHYINKFFSDLFHWDDFDYYVLRIQLQFNIITMLITFVLWSLFKVSATAPPSFKIWELFRSTPIGDANPSDRVDAHIYDLFPICLLAISLGTVYAFYPSIAPYSIIDYQYASVVELWILIISAIPPLLIAVLDTIPSKIGPSGKVEVNVYIESSGANNVSFTDNASIQFNINDLEVKHDTKTDDSATTPIKVFHKHKNTLTANYHTAGECPDTASHANGGQGAPQFHAYKPTGNYTIQAGSKYWEPLAINARGTFGDAVPIPTTATSDITIYYDVYINWFGYHAIKTLTPGSGATPANLNWSSSSVNPDPSIDLWYWNCVWLCAIFYILCIQIFMSMLHYPDCLISCFFKKPGRIGFISVLFNTVRETMQACGFSGAGKQCTNFNKINKNHLNTSVETYTIDNAKIISPSTAPDGTSVHLQFSGLAADGKAPLSSIIKGGTPEDINDAQFKLKAGSSSTKTLYLPKVLLKSTDPTNGTDLNTGKATINGSIASTNKLITLFVMMFCVFTGDGYLQHYRRCCRDCWPTTGFTKYQSFFIGYVMVLKVVLNLFVQHLLLQ